MVTGDVSAARQRTLRADWADLQEGVQNARPWILPKGKVALIEVGKAKESTWRNGFQSSEEKKREMGAIAGSGISQEPNIIYDTEKKT